MTDNTEIKALTFDVFGTVVDWRGSIIEEGKELSREWGLEVDWSEFADAWRALYQPSMSKVRTGARPWVNLDTLHRESLLLLLKQFGISGLDKSRLEHLNRAWHRLKPWPDSVEGLTKLKLRFVLSTLSNGNTALLVNMAKNAGLPWDAVLGAEIALCYKPLPDAYLKTARLLGLEPGECMMVAAHNGDLQAAGALGFRTAFVVRSSEHGPGQNTDLEAESDYDFVAVDFLDLAAQLGC